MCTCFSFTSEAGVMVAPGAMWQTFSFRAEQAEPTVNYAGYGASLKLGYSAGQVFDLALFEQYSPASVGFARSITVDDAVLNHWGAEVALRLARSVYIAARGGTLDFHLLHPKDPDEIHGHWQGYTAGGSLGGMFAMTKTQYWQISVDAAASTKMVKPDDPSAGAKQMDIFSVTLAYVFNGYYNTAIDNTVFKDFLDTLW